MAYKALYRTYRPQTFEEVAGQQHIVKTLRNALESGKIAHAYLFAGPRGTGKTTMAKLFAKALNCEEGIGHQCNECKNCKAIMEGSHPDVLELDAASNNGVDEIRELIDKVKYGTILGRYKVYIIDEVHMLSTGAFNALLKTLEEPPEHVIFILATTEPHKILPTILSRCQRYDFEKVSDADIKERIKVVLAEEGVRYDEGAINLIIKLADGGMRDALSILEKVLAYSGNNLNEKDVLDIFSLESTEEKINLLKSVLSHDVKDILDRLERYVSSGTDIKRLTEDLLTILKDILIYNSSYNADYLDILKENEVKLIANEIDDQTNIKMIEVLLNTLKDYKTVTSIAPLFEITLLKLASIGGEAKPVEAKPIPTVSKPAPTPIAPAPTPVVTPKPEPAPIKVEEAAPLVDIKLNDSVIYLKDAEQEDSFLIDSKTIIEIMSVAKKEYINDMRDKWSKVKKYITNPVIGKAATLLIDAHPLVATNNILLVEFQLQKAADKANLKSNQLEIQTVISQLVGRKMFVYALSRSASVDLQNKFMSLYQLKELPKPEEVNLEFIGE